MAGVGNIKSSGYQLTEDCGDAFVRSRFVLLHAFPVSVYFLTLSFIAVLPYSLLPLYLFF
jgi:hypothetical protein